MPEQNAVHSASPEGGTGYFPEVTGGVRKSVQTQSAPSSALTGINAPFPFIRPTPAAPLWPDISSERSESRAPLPPPEKTLAEKIRDGWVTARKEIKDFLNPAYHYHKVRQDWAALMLARKAVYEDVRGNPGEFSKMLYGRMTACAGFSEALDILSPLLGFGIQVVTGNPWLGLGVSWLAGYAFCVATFQAAWFLSNRDIYSSNYRSVWKQIVEMEKDVWPMHKQAAKVAIPLFGSIVALNGVGIQIAMTHLGKEVARVIPFGPILAAVKSVVSPLVFLRLIGNFNRDYAEKLVQKYRSPAPVVAMVSESPVDDKWAKAAEDSRCGELVDILGKGGTVEVRHELSGDHRTFNISLDSVPLEEIKDEKVAGILAQLRDSMIETAGIDDPQTPFTMKIAIPQVQ